MSTTGSTSVPTHPGLTPDQARAVRAPGSVTVTAGAGTGKTHMLAHRYVHHLRAGLSPLQIVAVTFTEKAAAELRARVRGYVARELPGRSDLLAELEAAPISTIHALAARVVRDHPDEADAPPDFAVLEEPEGGLWRSEQLEAAIAALPDEVTRRLPYRRLREALERLLADPVPAAEALARGPEGWAELVERARADAVRDLTGDPAWREAAALVRAAAGAEGDKAEDARRLAARGLDLLDAGETAGALACFDAIDLRGGSKKGWPDGDLKPVKDALRVLRDAARAAVKEGLITLDLGPADERLAEVLPCLRAAFDHVRARLAEAKRRERALDFADLEAHALRALEHEPVRAFYAERWRALLVDEVQDTNPVQERILGAIGGACDCTFVGDEKQSIYSFRGADATVFRRMREEVAGRGGSDVALRESFRTHAALVRTLNGAFAPVLGDLHGPLDAARAPAPHPAPHLRFLAVASEKGSKKLQRQVTEARAIGTEIRRLLDEGALVFDKRANAPRPVRPGDIAVLSRGWAPLDVYAEVLPGLGVPAVHTGGGDLLGTREAKDALALLRFLADPSDDLALAAVLRSPFFAVDDRTLHAFASSLPVRDTERPAWWTAMTAEDAALPAPLERPAAVLAGLLRARRGEAPSRLLALADAWTGYTAVLANLPGAARREADWSGFLELVRGLERGLHDAFSVVRRLRRLVAAEAEAPRPALEAGDAVALTTIHKSKGLEWPVVFVADLARSGGGSAPKVLMDRELGVALELKGEDGATLEPCLLTLLKARRKAAEDAEAKRVLYVALTRARDAVVLTAERDEGGLLEHLLPGLEAVGVECEHVPHDAGAATYPAQPAPDAAGRPDPARLWERRPDDLPGGLARSVPSKLLPEPAPEADGPTGGPDAAGAGDDADERWQVALDGLEMLDDPLLDLAARLRDAGAPAPDANGFDVELARGGDGTGQSAALVWTVGGARVALVHEALQGGEYDERLVRADPDDPDAPARVLSALAG